MGFPHLTLKPMKIEIIFKYNNGVFCNIGFTMIFNMKFTLLTFITNPHFKFDLTAFTLFLRLLNCSKHGLIT